MPNSLLQGFVHFRLTRRPQARRVHPNRVWMLLLSGLLIVLVNSTGARAQQSSSQPDDVVRISTELVQTDVMVFDRDGRFVDGLKPEQFELRVDGKPRPISFFERITAGKYNEEAQLAAARGKPNSTTTETGVKPMDRGRTVFFFVDDLHHSIASLIHTRKTLLAFINNEMGQNDQIAIASASGQIGFLQQLTDNKAVLRAAIARLTLPSQPSRDLHRPTMTEPMALGIERQNDPDLLNYFTEPMVRDGTPREIAESIVRGRAKEILKLAAYLTKNTLATLETLARRAGGVPGRKLVFFISDGFVLNTSDGEMFERLRNITNTASRNSLVIYTVDSRGLTVGSIGDASMDGGLDLSGRASRYLSDEVSVSQEPLRTLAANTGGRALLNTNSPLPLITKAVEETSVYYLLAWRPEDEKQRVDKFRRIEVSLRDRRDLTVSVRRGYYDVIVKPIAKRNEAPPKPPAVKSSDEELREAIKAAYPENTLPTSLSLVYLDVPDKGMVLASSMQIGRQFISFGLDGNKQKGLVDIAGVVMNAHGKQVASFRDRLDIVLNSPNATGLSNGDLVYNYQSTLVSGLYQVRVAARDNKSGKIGSASEWIELPDLASGRLSLSSLLLGEVTNQADGSSASTASTAQPSVSFDRRFSQTSKLRFMTFIYNAARGANASPDVALQVQVLRDDQPVLTTALRKVQHQDATDLARLAYAAELSLESMLPGHYVLVITVIDRVAKTSASQRSAFEIE